MDIVMNGKDINIKLKDNSIIKIINKSGKEIDHNLIKKYIEQNLSFKEGFLEKNNLGLLKSNLNLLNKSTKFNDLDESLKDTLGEVSDLILLKELKNETKVFKNHLIENNNNYKKNIDFSFEDIEDKFIKAELFKMEQLQAQHITRSLNSSFNSIQDINNFILEDENYKTLINGNMFKLDSINQKEKVKNPIKIDKQKINVKKWINKILQIDVLENNIKREYGDIKKEEQSMLVHIAKNAKNNLDPALKLLNANK